MISFYIFFSLFVIRMAGALFDQLLMAFSDLAIYAEGAETVSKQTEAMLQIYLSGFLSKTAIYFSLVFHGLTIGTCSYPIWMYLKMRKRHLNRT